MFLDYYRLREDPFGVTPDPRYLFLGRTHREALASLYFGVEAGRGFMALIAEPGMGKTTILNQLMQRLRNSASVAFLFQTQCNSHELLRYLLADMGLETGEQDTVNLHEQLNRALIRMARTGRRFVLVIDEAQNMDSSVLETVRLLSDFETPSSKLIQIILSGQPQLAEKLASPSLMQLRQRIAILSRLEPFVREETAEYIRHRLRVAGHEKGNLFSPGAQDLIADRSEGIPRNINNLCFNSLSLGCALRKSKIGREMVLEAVKDLEMESLAPVRNAARHDRLMPASAETHNVLRSVRHLGIGHEIIGSVALVVLFFLMFLPLFPSIGQDYEAWIAKARNLALEAGEQIKLNFPVYPRAVATVRGNSHTTQPSQVSSVPTQAGHPRDIVEVKPGNTFSQICNEHFGRIDKELVHRIRILNPQIKDTNHIETGQRIVLPGREPMSTGTFSLSAGKVESVTSMRN